MTTPTKVHIIVRGFQAITEFSGHNDDCGPCAEEVCLACIENRWPSGDEMNTIRQRDIERGWFTPGGGNTLRNVYDDATQLAGATVTDTPFGSDPEVIHQHMREALLHGNPCVLNLGNATALPGNERGVHWHFVACGGIDSTLGYLIANGDQAPFTGTYWVSWDAILQAQPAGLLEFHMPDVAPQGGTTMSTVQDLEAAGWHDDGTTLTAPNGHTLHEGFRGLILDAPSWDVTDQPLDDGYSDRVTPGASGQLTTYHSFHWDGAKCWAAPAGPELQAAETTITTMQGQLDTANALTIALQTQAAQLQAQVTQLQSAPVVTIDPDMEALAQLITKVVLKTEKSLVTHV